MSRIVIADDHPIIISGIEALLRGSDYRIVAKASNGAQALAAVARDRPDILVMDINMPVLSGIEALQSLRQRGDDLPVVMLTAAMDRAEFRAALECGVSGIVLKDTAAESLLLCLDAVRDGGRWIDASLEAAATRDEAEDASEDVSRKLSQRERDVAELVSRGMRNREIAAELGITEGTVKLHLHKIYEKLGIGSRTQLAIRAKELR